MRRRIAVVGAGSAGLTAALALRRLGCEVAVFEKQHAVGLPGGVLLQPNGLRVLEALGVYGLLAPILRGCGRMAIERTTGVRQADFAYSRLSQGCSDAASVGHAQLLEYLGSAAEWADIPIVFGRRCTGVQHDGAGCVVHFAHGASYECDLVVAADGAHSATCEAAGIGGRVRSVGLAHVHGVVERYTAAPTFRELRTADGRSCLIWPLPGQRTALACEVPVGGWRAILRHGAADWVESWRIHSAEVGALLDAVDDLGSLGYREVFHTTRPRWWQGPVVAIGGAAHAMSPFLQQSVSAGMVDALVLARLLCAADDDLATAGPAFEQQRMPFAREVQRAGLAADLGWRPRTWLRRLVDISSGPTIDWRANRLARLAAGTHPPDEPFFAPLSG